MREFPNYLMRSRQKVPLREAAPLQGIALTQPLKQHDAQGREKRLQQEQETELRRLETHKREPFKPKVLPPSQMFKKAETTDYDRIKATLRRKDDSFLLFCEHNCVLHDELKHLEPLGKASSSLKETTKKSLHRSMDGILAKEVSPNHYFKKSIK